MPGSFYSPSPGGPGAMPGAPAQAPAPSGGIANLMPRPMGSPFYAPSQYGQPASIPAFSLPSSGYQMPQPPASSLPPWLSGLSSKHIDWIKSMGAASDSHPSKSMSSLTSPLPGGGSRNYSGGPPAMNNEKSMQSARDWLAALQAGQYYQSQQGK